jgi:hypothetical protein
MFSSVDKKTEGSGIFVSGHSEDIDNTEVDIGLRMKGELNWVWIICQAFMFHYEKGGYCLTFFQ